MKSLPTEPGVYLMKDRRSKVIYVGKAKSLKNRVRQYFGSSSDKRPMIPYLLREVEDIEVIVVSSEKEALLLENTLIKQHQPKYNATLKDDKTYICLKINHRHKWPMIRLVRYQGKPKSDGLYFGPYSSAYAARQTLDLLKRIFPLRQCSDRELAKRDRPCILYDMRRCCAPCVGKVEAVDYQNLVNRAIQFLRGKDEEILKELYGEMEAASHALEFERAGALLRTIRAIEQTTETQRVHQALGKDRDVIGLFRQGDELMLTQLIFREGKLVGSEHHSFSGTAQEDPALLESFILQHYDSQSQYPQEILLPSPVEAKETLEEILSEVAGHRIYIQVPQRGDKWVLVKMAQANSKVEFTQRKDSRVLTEKRLLELEERLRLTNYPQRIECFDTSNLGGQEPVAAMVAFTDGVPDKNRYRKYKVKTVEGPNDYGAMEEVLTRRLRRGKEEQDLPDLLIVDGGKGHLNMALRVCQNLDISTMDIVGLAKEEGRHDRGMTAERVFLPNVKDPILFKSHSQVLFLLQQIRDEAHRVAIGFQRQRRQKQTLSSELEKVPGIGPIKRKRLLKHFGSWKRVAEASSTALCEVPGIGPKDAEAIRQYVEQASRK